MSARDDGGREPRSGQPVAILTGATGGVGRSTAAALRAKGARLVLVDLDVASLSALADRCGGPSFAQVLPGDVADPSMPGNAFDLAEVGFGRVDALVNNAGIEGPVARVEEVAAEEMRRVFEVNVFALFAFSQEAVRRFRARGSGRLVNMASGAGLAGSGMMSAYSSSKHAVIGLTRSIAREVAGAGIQVNAVCPGCVESPMMDRIEERLGELAGGGPTSFLAGIPAGRYCDPGEVADLVAWLALEAPPYVNGSALVIDGAMRA
jgi:NAD(P)-dependent dehydrogenase (short-subunit alcohol dehydrogenase family)